jgi:hypothetical protein
MHRNLPLRLALAAACILSTGAFAASAFAQRIEVEAAAGVPYGVGRIAFDPPAGALPQPLGVEGILLTEKNGRAWYPTIENPAFAKLLKELLERDTPLTSGGPVREEVGGLLRGILDRPPRTTIYFLFTGNEPLELSLRCRDNISLAVVPRQRPAVHRRLLDQWWRSYARPAGLLAPKPDFPPLVETYLCATLARRLNLQLPKQLQTPPAQDDLRKQLGLSLGTESLRLSLMQDRILGLNDLALPADQPLPQALDEPPLQTPKPQNEPPIEPIAKHVPAECFYVRFGNFGNFLWIQDTLARWGGDAQNLVALRGLDRGQNERIERRLALKQTLLSRMLGDTVIADVAMIGTDMFFREGASFGLLFQAKNNLALSTSLRQQRAERVAGKAAKEETLKIGDATVSFLTSPDGAIRSYYVADGDYHLIATSRTLVERFLAAGRGIDALGATAEFRHARTLMPLDRGDTIWAYLSDDFFRNIISSKYRIEMARRLQAAADLELVGLARLAAVGQGRKADAIEDLIAAGTLPPEFGPLPDGSRVLIEADGLRDSLRGRQGAFLPVADVDVGKITQAEAAEYRRFSDALREQWGRIDPIIVGVKRTAQKGGREQIVVDALVSPFAAGHFATLGKYLGPADPQRLAAIPGDVAALELVLSKQRIFGGLRDIGPPARPAMTGWLPGMRFRDFVVGYIGTTGDLGPLQLLNIGIPPGSDPAGYAVSPLNGWRRQYGQFTLFSFQREVLEEVAPQLRFEEADRAAQVRLRVDDLSNARITPMLNDLGYARTRETSLGNLRLLAALEQQLRVPAAECRLAAETLLDARLKCPLGGEYKLQEEANAARWTSTALTDVQSAGLLKVHAPEGYQSPPLSWFRGLKLEASMTERAVSVHAEIIMQMPEKR